MGSSKRKHQEKNCKKPEKKFKIIFFLQNIFFFKNFIKYQLIYRAIATTFFKHFFWGVFWLSYWPSKYFVFRQFSSFFVFLVPPRGPPFTPLPQPSPKIKNI